MEQPHPLASEVGPNQAMTVDFASDSEAIVIAVQLDRQLAERVFADAEVRGVRPADVVQNALTEHYQRTDLHG